MTSTLPEIANPFRSAKVISVDCPTGNYLATGVIYARGDHGFIMSRSQLMNFATCPHRWRNGHEDNDDTKSTEWGTLVDALFLQREHFEKRFVLPPKTYEVEKKGTKTGEVADWTWHSPVCQRWKRDQRLTVTTEDECQEAQRAVDALMSDLQIARLIEHSQKQVFVLAEYHDKETGIVVPFKAMLDLVPDLAGEFPKCLFDFKTAAFAAPRPWSKQAFNCGYHVQAASYLDAYVAATGEDRCDFRWIIQENIPPYEVTKRFCSTELLNLGREQYVSALKRYCRCLADDDWPGYSDPQAMKLDDGFEAVDREAWMIT